MKILPFLAVILMFSSCNNKNEVDLIIKNAKIYTVDKNFSVVQGAAIKDGKFVAVGSDASINSHFSAKKILDLNGQFVYPGFMDAHCHFYGYALSLTQADLKGTKSFEDVVEKTKAHFEKYNSDWILGRGWDQNDWEVKEFPTKDLLDKAFPDKPVLLRRIDGHAAVANTMALKMAGLTKDTHVNGGKILLHNGEPTGLLVDMAVDLVMKIIPEPGIEQQSLLLQQAEKNCFKVGLTSVGDAGLKYEVIHLFDSLQQSQKLHMRIYAMLDPATKNFEDVLKKGFLKTDYLDVRSIKLYADGALGSRGACLLEPYSDDPGNYGMIVQSPDSLKSLCEMAYNYNYQVNTHCIGDSANRMMLDIYGEILKTKNDRRWRIEHAQVINKDDVHKYGDYSVIPSIQTTHCTSDMYWAPDRLGPERIKEGYIWRDLLKQNDWLPNGSDFPIEDINPLYGFYAAVTRQDQSGYPEKGFYPEQKLSRMQALKAMTIWAAKAQFEENEKGSIEPGKFADFVITDHDLMSEKESGLFKIPVEKTYSKGVLVYSAGE